MNEVFVYARLQISYTGGYSNTFKQYVEPFLDEVDSLSHTLWTRQVNSLIQKLNDLLKLCRKMFWFMVDFCATTRLINSSRDGKVAQERICNLRKRLRTQHNLAIQLAVLTA